MDQIQDLHSPMSPISESPSSPAYSTGMASGGGRVGVWWGWPRVPMCALSDDFCYSV